MQNRRHNQSDYIKTLETLYSQVSDMVNGNRLKEFDIPDDFQALTSQLRKVEQALTAWQEPLSAKQNVAVVMNDGVIQAVVAERPEELGNINLVLIDYDTDGADEHELVSVPQGEGAEDQEAYMRGLTVVQTGIDLKTAYDRFLEQAEAEEARFTTGMR